MSFLEDAGFRETEIPRRRGRGWVVLAAIVVLVLVAGVALDGIARLATASYVRGQVRSSLAIAQTTPIDVSIGGTSVLYQLATGRLDRVSISAEALTIGDVTGDAKLVGIGVPTDLTKPIERATVSFTVGPQDTKKLLAGIHDITVTSVDITGNVVQVGTSIKVFGIDIPLGISFTPGAKDGKLTLTPKALQYKGLVLTTAGFTKVLGALANPFIKTRSVCVASYLPSAFTLTTASAHTSSLELAVAGDNVVIDDTLLSKKGTCK